MKRSVKPEVVVRVPSESELDSELGSAAEVWRKIIALIDEKLGPVKQEWKASKSSFGEICLLKKEKRTLVYLTPDEQQVTVAVVLGERAVALALTSDLPENIKELIKEARSYAEGRGIRFTVRSVEQASLVANLVLIKTRPA